MKVAYIAGPYRAFKADGGFSLAGVWDNIMRARKVGEKYWHKGYACVIPHLNTMFMDCDVSDEHWLNGDLEILKRCDVIIMCPGWLNSNGAKAELEFAQKNGLQVIYEEDESNS